MIVSGVPVTVEQALEIIRRTDNFFQHPGYLGNDRKFNERLMARFRIPGSWEAREGWSTDWGVIQTEYVTNSWIACAYIYGPHGWCHPDGVIGFVDNVGKWPTVKDILEEWTLLAEAFPFLDVGVTLMDREHCEDGGVPLVSIRVLYGTCTLVDPRHTDVHGSHPPVDAGRQDAWVRHPEDGALLHRHECAIPEEVFAAWEKR
jgi:hypothetical protein